MTKKAKVPITVISGYLGVGKTTLINRLLSNSAKNIGVLVNDFGALNIDADLILNSNGVTMELTNGCLCCQITDDLGDTLMELSKTDVSEVLIEASGVAQPEAIAEYVQSWPGYTLAGVYTLVDASRFEQSLENRFARPLILNQIKQADVLLLSKTDLMRASDQQSVRQNFTARFNKPVYDLKQDAVGWILNQTQDNQLDNALGSEAQKIYRGDAKPETNGKKSTYKLQPEFKSAVYQPKQALKRQTLEAFLDQHKGIVRAKGWFNDDENQCWLLQSAGDRRNYEKQTKQQPSRLVFIYPASEDISLELLTAPG